MFEEGAKRSRMETSQASGKSNMPSRYLANTPQETACLEYLQKFQVDLTAPAGRPCRRC